MQRFWVATMALAGLTFGIGVNSAAAQHAHEGDETAGQSHERAEGHGGAVTMSKEFHVETVFLPDQVRLYLYDQKQNPMHVKHWEKGLVEATGVMQFRDRQRGTATLEFTRAAPDDYACPMHPGQRSNKPGQCPECSMKFSKQDIPEGTLWSCPMHPDENGKAKGKCADCGMKYAPQDYLAASVNLEALEDGAAKVTINLNNLAGMIQHTLQFTEKFKAAKKGQAHDEGGHEDGEHEHGGHVHGDHDH
ncbi:MAG: heavy metal-binding domain-containing protein [Phycisphaerae bacterium]